MVHIHTACWLHFFFLFIGFDAFLALGEEAETVGLLRNVKTIVPFAPLRHADIEKILKMQLNAMLESGVRSP